MIIPAVWLLDFFFRGCFTVQPFPTRFLDVFWLKVSANFDSIRRFLFFFGWQSWIFQISVSLKEMNLMLRQVSPPCPFWHWKLGRLRTGCANIPLNLLSLLLPEQLLLNGNCMKSDCIPIIMRKIWSSCTTNFQDRRIWSLQWRASEGSFLNGTRNEETINIWWMKNYVYKKMNWVLFIERLNCNPSGQKHVPWICLRHFFLNLFFTMGFITIKATHHIFVFKTFFGASNSKQIRR